MCILLHYIVFDYKTLSDVLIQNAYLQFNDTHTPLHRRPSRRNIPEHLLATLPSRSAKTTNFKSKPQLGHNQNKPSPTTTTDGAIRAFSCISGDNDGDNNVDSLVFGDGGHGSPISPQNSATHTGDGTAEFAQAEPTLTSSSATSSCQDNNLRSTTAEDVASVALDPAGSSSLTTPLDHMALHSSQSAPTTTTTTNDKGDKGEDGVGDCNLMERDASSHIDGKSLSTDNTTPTTTPTSNTNASSSSSSSCTANVNGCDANDNVTTPPNSGGVKDSCGDSSGGGAHGNIGADVVGDIDSALSKALSASTATTSTPFGFAHFNSIRVEARPSIIEMNDTTTSLDTTTTTSDTPQAKNTHIDFASTSTSTSRMASRLSSRYSMSLEASLQDTPTLGATETGFIDFDGDRDCG